jgi:hypothetical protein
MYSSEVSTHTPSQTRSNLCNYPLWYDYVDATAAAAAAVVVVLTNEPHGTIDLQNKQM